MKEILLLLPQDDFMKCHRSYVVNMRKVKSVDLEDDLIILEERTVPVSKREKDKLLERLKWI
jgi:DNA-binding LytR/AlgR family response regulator